MIVADGTVKGAMDDAIAEVVGHFGRLDGLAVTAGTMQTRKTLIELEDEVWEEYFQVHVMTTVRACRGRTAAPSGSKIYEGIDRRTPGVAVGVTAPVTMPPALPELVPAPISP